MAAVIHQDSGLIVGDENDNHFPDGVNPEARARLAAADQMILSPAGWRKVFAPGGESDASAVLSPADREIAAVAAGVFHRFLSEQAAGAVVVGSDSRPTGRLITDIVLRTLVGLGAEVRFLFIVPLPELLAYVSQAAGIAGFVYVSASHNPIGHNGFKFGLTDGGILSSAPAAELAEAFRTAIRSDGEVARCVAAARDRSRLPAVAAAYAAAAARKAAAAAAYTDFTRRVVAGTDDGEKTSAFFRTLTTAVGGKSGVVIDFNGSARTLGVDRALLEEIGLKVLAINDRPGEIVHQIVPEGLGLEPARLELERAAAEDARFTLGYVPDNDGDRGNIVAMVGGRARALDAQEVFALATIAELAIMEWAGRLTYDGQGRPIDRTAVVVNDATSLRIDRLAAAFGVEVHRAETGEANVVALARRLRSEGVRVPILGEGSNGGVILHPSAVRDPLDTILLILSFLYLGPSTLGETPRAIWRRRSGGSADLGNDDLDLVLRSLPRFHTLSAYQPEALVSLATQDHGLLKLRYEAAFEESWPSRFADLGRFGIVGWEERNYEGREERRGFGPACRTGNQRGGLAIRLLGAGGDPAAFLWMRGSATEPVFRILVDVEGDQGELFGYLLDWQTDLVRKADKGSPR